MSVHYDLVAQPCLNGIQYRVSERIEDMEVRGVISAR